MRACIYARISRDPEGERAGVQRQQEDARALADRNGYEIVAEYVDNDISASTLSRKARPAYAEMMAAAAQGDFDVIVAYSNSRLTRRLRELEDLVDLHDQHGIRIMTVVSGSDDLSTADGRMTARIKASVDAGEAERAGERIARAHLQRAREGKVNTGGRPFGWQADKLSIAPAEAKLIREAASDVIDGMGLIEVARRWNLAGVTTARGNVWDHRSVRQLLRSPRLAGWRLHRGEIATDVTGEPVHGQWEPILAQEVYDRLQVALRGRQGRSGGRRGARRYLLSGVLRCGTCGARMYGTPTKQGHAYACRGQVGADSHTVSIAGVPTDDIVTEVVVARLDQRGEIGEVAPEAPPGADRLEQIPVMIAELMGAYNAGRLSAAVVFPQVEQLEAERSELSAQRQAHIAATAGPSKVDSSTFLEADVDRKRRTVEDVLDAIVVAPTQKGARWNPSRLTYVWSTVN